MSDRTSGWSWLVWTVREGFAWSAVLWLVFTTPEVVYRWRLEPQLIEVRQLREQLDRELQQLRGEEWEQWAGRAMARVRQKASMAVAQMEEDERGEASGGDDRQWMVPLRPGRRTRLSAKSAPAAKSESPATGAPPAGKSAPPADSTPGENSIPPVNRALPENSAPPANSMPPVSRRGNVLLRIPGVGPEDVVWTTIDAFYHAPYEWGGEDDLGVDCSALVQQVFGRLDVDLPRTAQEQFDSRIGVYVGLEDVRPGDLLFFHTRPRPYIGHVGIYAGDGEFIHAPRPGRRVEFQELNGFYRKRFVAAKRILGGSAGPIGHADHGRLPTPCCCASSSLPLPCLQTRGGFSPRLLAGNFRRSTWWAGG